MRFWLALFCLLSIPLSAFAGKTMNIPNGLGGNYSIYCRDEQALRVAVAKVKACIADGSSEATHYGVQASMTDAGVLKFMVEEPGNYAYDEKFHFLCAAIQPGAACTL